MRDKQLIERERKRERKIEREREQLRGRKGRCKSIGER